MNPWKDIAGDDDYVSFSENARLYDGTLYLRIDYQWETLEERVQRFANRA